MAKVKVLTFSRQEEWTDSCLWLWDHSDTMNPGQRKFKTQDWIDRDRKQADGRRNSRQEMVFSMAKSVRAMDSSITRMNSTVISYEYDYTLKNVKAQESLDKHKQDKNKRDFAQATFALDREGRLYGAGTQL